MFRSSSRQGRQFVRRFDAYQQHHQLVGFGYAVMRKYLDDEASHKAALIAFYGFLSIFPLLLLLTTVFHIFLHDDTAASSQIIHGAVTYFPVIGHELQMNIKGLASSGTALVVGIVLTLFGARGVADALRSSFDHIWHVPYAKRSVFPASLGRSIAIVLIGGFGLALVPILSGYAYLFGGGMPFRLLSITITTAALFVVLVFVIKIGTSGKRTWRQIWIGSAFATIGLELLQVAGGVVVARELQHLNTLYGTFALVLGLLYWLYLQALVLLLALELDSVRTLRLWPRSAQPPLTSADRAAYELYADRARYHDPT